MSRCYRAAKALLSGHGFSRLLCNAGLQILEMVYLFYKPLLRIPVHRHVMPSSKPAFMPFLDLCSPSDKRQNAKQTLTPKDGSLSLSACRRLDDRHELTTEPVQRIQR